MEETDERRVISENEIKYLVLGWYIYEILLKK
jgi:hypothetical protein